MITILYMDLSTYIAKKGKLNPLEVLIVKTEEDDDISEINPEALLAQGFVVGNKGPYYIIGNGAYVKAFFEFAAKVVGD